MIEASANTWGGGHDAGYRREPDGRQSFASCWTVGPVTSRYRPDVIGLCAVYVEPPDGREFGIPRSSARIMRNPSDGFPYLSDMMAASAEDNARMGELFAELCVKLGYPKP